MGEIHEHWRISVESSGDLVVAIENDCLAGRKLSEIDYATIRHAITHLTAFLGDDDQLTALQAENERLRDKNKRMREELAIKTCRSSDDELQRMQAAVDQGKDII